MIELDELDKVALLAVKDTQAAIGRALSAGNELCEVMRRDKEQSDQAHAQFVRSLEGIKTDLEQSVQAASRSLARVQYALYAGDMRAEAGPPVTVELTPDQRRGAFHLVED